MRAVIRDQRKRIGFWFKFGILVLTLATAYFFLNHKKEALINSCSNILQSFFKRQTDLEFHIEKASGNLLGFVRFEGVRVEAPWLLEETRTVFRAKEISVQYRFLDFLSKKFDSKITVTVKKPVILWAPRFRLRRSSFPFFGWMREWALSGLQNLALDVEGLEIGYANGKKRLGGINALFSSDEFRMEVPLTHVDMAGFDVTSVIHVNGRFEAALSRTGSDSISGEVTTQGTVINWKPIANETHFDFRLEPDQIHVTGDDFLGGFQVMAKVDFKKDFELSASVRALNYPLSNIKPFLGTFESFSIPSRLDLEADFSGILWEPQMALRARLYDGRIGKQSFKVLDLNGSGVYPTIRLSDSKVLMSDGTTSMRFADRALEVGDFFKDKVFQTLISEAQQDRVVWGDWDLSRPKDSNDLSEFMMQRVLGDNASVHFRSYNQDKEKPLNLGSVEPAPMEVGFEYRLRPKDSLKVELREDEEFVGVERKVKF